tara:strand:+ start:715 stop:1116 length:402 start_codon:yes stop_codon:yes gene_type:complete
MNFQDIKLPSNKKFGFFMSFIFGLASIYLFYRMWFFEAYIFTLLAFIFFIVALIRPKYLLFLNKLWMGLGFILGLVIQPIILGLIFFGIFTPIAFVMRVFGRDELRLKLNDTSTFWKNRVEDFSLPDTFKNQF